MSKKSNVGSPRPTKGQRFEQVEQSVKRTEMQLQVFQMLSQQMGNTVVKVQETLDELVHKQRELQYRTLALQSLVPGVTLDVIQEKATSLQVEDFEELNEKENTAKGYTAADLVADNSAIVLTTTTDGENDKGVLRSKLVWKEIGYPELKDGALGKKAGDKFDATIDNTLHHVVLLEVYTVPEVKADAKQENG